MTAIEDDEVSQTLSLEDYIAQLAVDDGAHPLEQGGPNTGPRLAVSALASCTRRRIPGA